MIFSDSTFIEGWSLSDEISNAYYMPEAEAVKTLIDYIDMDDKTASDIEALAKQLVETVREKGGPKNGIEALMYQYDLSCEEGVLLMCLAEALLRIPDKETENALIRDKLSGASFDKHKGKSESSFVNLATWGLNFTSKLMEHDPDNPGHYKSLWQKMLARTGEPMVRKAMRHAMKVLSEQFVLGRTINEALKNTRDLQKQGYSFSFDMLGEVARTQKDAEKYFTAYQDAITSLSEEVEGKHYSVFTAPSISVKLSALYPRYEFAQSELAIPSLVDKVDKLCQQAMAANIALTIDAEEADRLEISLHIIKAIFNDEKFKAWEGFGLALQSYQKRAFYVIDWLAKLSKHANKKIQVRLVKGAYWDTEIKLAQVEGLNEYPVFTRKVATDVNYIACAKKLLSLQDNIYPQFATHNAYSVAAVLTLMKDPSEYKFEFQNLQGMGRALHDEIIHYKGLNIPSRIYAPVGIHEDLLPYLVRRLLENGANSSFVNRIVDDSVSIDDLVENPIRKLQSEKEIRNPKIPLPADIYGESRVNSMGFDIADMLEMEKLQSGFELAATEKWQAMPTAAKSLKDREAKIVTNPFNLDEMVGTVIAANEADIERSLENASEEYSVWNAVSIDDRAKLLEKTADLLEEHAASLMYLTIKEAGRVIPDAISEVREAVDFCRYYAVQARKSLSDIMLPGPTGESNRLITQGKGTFLCISPWNFPIAIFCGQVAAALVAGNCVIAKPAEQTPLTAALVVKLMHEAGIPEKAIQLLPGKGSVVGAKCVADPRVCGVLFTGSNATANVLERTLAEREGAIATLVAETGGINAMIADSSTLPEQLVFDVIASAFGSAGQRCSGLRLLYVQEEIADRVIEMLQGAMAEIKLGDPSLLNTDVGPVIDAAAKESLEKHIAKLKLNAKLIYEVKLPEACKNGTFVAPRAYELRDLEDLRQEVFGPVLHVIRYKRKNLDKVIADINDLGFGLTFGIHSRIDETVDYIQKRIVAGNIYVNRNMIGAVVGVQPFGGAKLSGTGPKAGGPHYLTRLVQEKTISIDTTAAGGNASLMSLGDE